MSQAETAPKGKRKPCRKMNKKLRRQVRVLMRSRKEILEEAVAAKALLHVSCAQSPLDQLISNALQVIGSTTFVNRSGRKHSRTPRSISKLPNLGNPEHGLEGNVRKCQACPLSSCSLGLEQTLAQDVPFRQEEI
jgi:hypothetical protein